MPFNNKAGHIIIYLRRIMGSLLRLVPDRFNSRRIPKSRKEQDIEEEE